MTRRNPDDVGSALCLIAFGAALLILAIVRMTT